MENYHYIIASLPELAINADNKNFSYDSVREFILESCTGKGKRFIEWFDFGTNEDNLSSHFYNAVFKCKNNFLKNYFALDLEIRNRKVDFVSNKMGTDADMYRISIDNPILNLSQTELNQLNEIFATKNVLEKEQKLDKFKWDFINTINPYGEFNVDVILAFLAKGKLIDRWNKLDKETGEELFQKLVNEVRGTFKGIDNKILE